MKRPLNPSRIRLLALATMFAGMLRPCVSAQDDTDLAPFVPTPQPVVDRILELARVNESDVVYDLGCGDGRIVVTAARKYGARGVGVDIDPQRVRESKRSATESGVDRLVTIREEDALTVDLSEATVVTLYLLPESNDRLRPRLERFLKPGARVVSHDFSMTGWRPTAVATVRDEDGDSHRLYLWVIGAEGKPVEPTFNGLWSWTTKTGDGRVEELALSLKHEGQRVTGFLKRNGIDAYPVTHGEAANREFRVVVDRRYRGEAVKQVFSGKLYGNIVRGQVHVETDDGASRSQRWRAFRQPASAAGRWRCSLLWGAQETPATLELTQAGCVLQGSYATGEERSPLAAARLSDNVVEFTVDPRHGASPGGEGKRLFRGWIEGDTISGQVTSDAGRGEWRATRE